MTSVRNERITEIAVALGAPLAALALYVAARGAMQSMREPARVVVPDALPVSSAPYGLALDTVNQDGRTITVSRSGYPVKRHMLHLGGWATEPQGKAPFGGLTAYLNGRRLQDVVYGLPRPDVAAHFKNPALRDVGWSVDVPPGVLVPGADTLKMSFVGAENDYVYPAPPIVLVVK